MKKRSRLMSFLLVMIMAVSLLPAGVRAEETDGVTHTDENEVNTLPDTPSEQMDDNTGDRTEEPSNQKEVPEEETEGAEKTTEEGDGVSEKMVQESVKNDPDETEGDKEPEKADDNGSGEELPDVNETGNELSENDQLLSMYMDKTLNDRLGNQAQLFSDSRDFKPPMSEATEKIYKDLKKQVQEIAKGNNVSTECSWKVPENLGITINAEAATEEAAIEEARAQLYKEVDLNAVVDALLVNCPYDLYWYDKKAGYHSECSRYSITRVSEDGPFTAVPQELSFSFSVAKEYTQEDGTSIDSYKIHEIQNSLDKISSIVLEAREANDYDKLWQYKQNICDLTSYNTEAANDESTPYGNPWQLIWVFDENPGTNVVSEGYSKAFQYLCDLTEFDSYIYCYSVSGTMTGGTGEDPHMWNIVHMGNGLNYLADITNCDDGTIGEGDDLFLQGSDNGSPQTGYTFDLWGGAISYVYGEDTKNIFTEDDLTLASEEFDGDYVNQVNKIVGHSLLLSSEIGVRFRVSFAGGYNPSNCVMNFKLSDGRKESVPIAEAEVIPVNEEKSDYCFTCYINPLELADNITATVSDGDTAILTDQYSAMNYIEYIQGNWEKMGEKGEKILDLVNALQDYGRYMQKSGWTDGKDSHARISVADYYLNDSNVEEVKKNVTEMQIEKNLDGTGIGRVKFSLNLNEATIVRIYAKPEEGSSISSASVISADGSVTSLNCNEKKVIDGEDYYQFATGKIGVANLGKGYTFKMTTEKGDAEVTVSALSYVYAVLNSESFTPAKKYAMTAFYYYYAAAERYVNS